MDEKPDNTWEPPLRLETEISRAIAKIINAVVKSAGNDLDLIQLYLRRLPETDEFQSYVHTLVSRMVTHLFIQKAVNFREAATKGGLGPWIMQALTQELSGHVGQEVKNLIAHNVHMISDIPVDVASELAETINRFSLTGRRADEIADILKQNHYVKRLSDSKVALIARTEVSKSSTALTRARSEDIGIPWYIWRTSGDVRVRPSHRFMALVLVPWSDAPAPEALIGKRSNLGHYHAGEAPNCRCYPEPLIYLNQVKWPARVYHSGVVRSINRFDFEKHIMKEAA